MTLDMHTFKDVRCEFYLRTPHGDGHFYDRFIFFTPGGQNSITTSMPPRVGDEIHLYDRNDEARQGVFRVVRIVWMYPSYLSMNWTPTGILVGPSATVIVERSEHPMRDEVVRLEEEDEDVDD